LHTQTIIKLAFSAVVISFLFILRCSKRNVSKSEITKKQKRNKNLIFWGLIIAIWYFVSTAFSSFTSGTANVSSSVQMFTDRTSIGFISISNATIIGYFILIGALVLSLLFRFFVFPKFKEEPRGMQNVAESIVESMSNFTGKAIGKLPDDVGAFTLSIAVFFVGCLISQFFGQRAPSSDLAFIFSIALVAFFIINHYIVKLRKATQEAEVVADTKTQKRNKRLIFWVMAILAWYFTASAVNSIFGTSTENEPFELFSSRAEIFGVSISHTTIISYAILAIVTIFALIFRFFVFPKFKEVPRGFQNAMESGIEAIQNFTHSIVGNLSDALPPYMMALAVFLVGCAISELFGQRPPTSDLEVTLSLALVTFFLINYYGIKEKHLKGRIKAMASPSPVIFPMKVLSDVAIPVSLSCRLFGNMLGGMIVMDLLKDSLGGYAIGVTALIGLYFNFFHPLIQTYIFIILSLTFIKEAAE